MGVKDFSSADTPLSLCIAWKLFDWPGRVCRHIAARTAECGSSQWNRRRRRPTRVTVEGPTRITTPPSLSCPRTCFRWSTSRGLRSCFDKLSTGHRAGRRMSLVWRPDQSTFVAHAMRRISQYAASARLRARLHWLVCRWSPPHGAIGGFVVTRWRSPACRAVASG